VGVLIVLALCPMMARAIAFQTVPRPMLWDRMQWESHTHSDGLLMGVLIAYLHLYHHAKLARLTERWQKPMLVVAVLCFASVFWRGGLFHRAPFAVIGQLFALSFGTALVLTMCLVTDNFLARALARAFWYPIARVSYGMYLIHPFVILSLLRIHPALAETIFRSTPYLLAYSAVVIVCTFLAASALFLLVELPAQRWGIRRTQPAPVA
jgi:peptidoglycan/LPS O-acetylase OafA/YrhL